MTLDTAVVLSGTLLALLALSGAVLAMTQGASVMRSWLRTRRYWLRHVLHHWRVFDLGCPWCYGTFHRQTPQPAVDAASDEERSD